MNRYDDDPVWDALFAKSQDMLVQMGEEALADMRAGRTQPIDAFFERAALIAARAGVIDHAGQRYAVTWDVCPWCEDRYRG